MEKDPLIQSRFSVSKIKGMLNKVWDVNFYFSYVHVPLVVLVLYFFSYAFLHAYILAIPVGVSHVFASLSWKYLALVATGSSLVLMLIAKTKGGVTLSLANTTDKLSIRDSILLLLPLTPVIQYIINNQEILSPLGSLYVIIAFTAFSAFYVYAIPALLSFVGSRRTGMALGLALVFTFTNMASLTHEFSWYEKGDIKVQWLFFSGVFLITWLLYDLEKKKYLALFCAVIFISNTSMQLINRNDRTAKISSQPAENKLSTLIEGREPIFTPNIYLLIYDAYVPNETTLAYSINNSSQEKYLQEQNFTLYPHTYSIANFSLGTMNRVLDASTEIIGGIRKSVSGDGYIQNSLRSFGYRNYGLFPGDGFFHNVEPKYDFYTPGRPSSPDILSRAILMGEFRFDIGFNTMPREEFLSTKQSVFENDSDQRIFVYMHSSYPGHSQNSGVCLPNQIEIFKDRLSTANSEMRQDIDTIIKHDPEAIVIVAGDHGPYLTKNCAGFEEGYDATEISRLDIQDRYGTFLAIRWPTDNYTAYDDIVVLQDVFPAVFAYLFNDPKILAAKIEPTTLSDIVKVKNGIIYGGIHDGEPLFLSEK